MRSPSLPPGRSSDVSSGTADDLGGLRSALSGVDFRLGLAGADDAARESSELVDQIDDYLLPRLQRLDAPLLAVLGGSTGAGKSTITNSIIGDDVSQAGVLRPTTRAPVLVCNPADADWFSDPDGVLAGLPRTTGVAGTASSGLRIVTNDGLAPGLAILDAPDIDSVEVANHDLAAQLLGAADLWVFVTTAARYADAVPWEYLGMAQERSAALAVVINRIPPSHEAEVESHFRDMLAERGLRGVEVFSIPEDELTDGRMPARIEPVRSWLASIAANAEARQTLVRSTLDGALASIPARVDRIASAIEHEAGSRAELESVMRRRFAQAVVDIDTELDRGTLLRGEVLDQWREFVGTGEFMSRLEAGISRIRDRVGGLFRTGPSTDQAVTGELESNLVVVARDAVDRAAIDTVELWESMPGGRRVLVDAPRGIERAGRQLGDDVERALNAWEQVVLDLVREQSGDKVTIARTITTGINGIGVALMIAVFSQTGGITGGEAAVAGGTAAVSQTVLTAVFGEQAVRDLARQAREDLMGRLEDVITRDRGRFDELIADDETDPAELRALAARIGG